jgi:nicotinamide-nucleotide amidase
MIPKIGILTIGTELLNGELADTNTARIAGALAACGYPVRESVTVADVEADIEEALLALAAKRDAVIVTGGLGPTGDDLTARAAARAFQRRLVLTEEALEQVRQHFRRTGREMHPRDEKQALLPQKATIIPNPKGSAPGFLLSHNGRKCFFLPGVPSEMAAMLEESVIPHLLESAGAAPPRQERTFLVFGLSEPKAEELLGTAGLPPGIEVGFGVDFPFVRAKLRAAGEDAGDVLDRAEVPARRALGRYLVGTGEDTLAGVVGRLLTGGGVTLAVAESCTGGLITAMLTDIPGSSAFLERGAVTYANTAKEDWLGVPADLLQREGAVSEACALAMARGIRRAAGAGLGVAVTGIAGPAGGTPQKPVGTVYIALSGEQAERAKLYRFGGDRTQIRRLAACTALEWVRRYMIEQMER